MSSNTATSTTTGTIATPSTISTTANYCGDQYNNKGCACMQQVTAGLTPATQSAANVTLICAYQENGIQYACDPGCCPGGTCSGTPASSNVASASTTTAGNTTTAGDGMNKTVFWAMVALGIVFAVVLILAVLYASTRK
jgi:hypothetical protein